MLSPENLEFLIQYINFWDDLREEEQTLLCTQTAERFHPRGSMVYSTAVACIGVLMVKEGALRTYILSEEGREITLFRTHAGEICVLSASCLLENITFDVFIEAERDTTMLCIPADVFAVLQKNNLLVENFALQSAVARFSDVMWAMQQILFMSVDRRLALFLLEEVEKAGRTHLTLTHEQIAGYIGSAREVVSRMLRYFTKEGWVTCHRGGIEVIVPGKLREIAQ